MLWPQFSPREWRCARRAAAASRFRRADRCASSRSSACASTGSDRWKNAAAATSRSLRPFRCYRSAGHTGVDFRPLQFRQHRFKSRDLATRKRQVQRPCGPEYRVPFRHLCGLRDFLILILSIVRLAYWRSHRCNPPHLVAHGRVHEACILQIAAQVMLARGCLIDFFEPKDPSGAPAVAGWRSLPVDRPASVRNEIVRARFLAGTPGLMGFFGGDMPRADH